MRTPELIPTSTGLPRWRNLPAPAKLNLFLHVVGRRPDGMHELQSIFVMIDWADYLDIEVRSDGRIERIDDVSEQPLALPADDLCVRAAKRLQEHSGVTMGATIRLLRMTANYYLLQKLVSCSDLDVQFLIASNKATQAPEIEAVRVPPSA